MCTASKILLIDTFPTLSLGIVLTDQAIVTTVVSIYTGILIEQASVLDSDTTCAASAIRGDSCLMNKASF